MTVVVEHDIMTVLRAYLVADAGVSAIAGNRVAWGSRPRTSALPAVALYIVDGERDYEMQAPSGLVRARVQADAWALTYDAAVYLSGAVRRALSGMRQTIEGIEIQGAFVDLERDLPDDEGGAHEVIYRVSQDFMVWHTE